MTALSRLDTSPFARWWWSVDRVALGLALGIMGVGAILILAAGPPAAARLGIDNPFHFPARQAVFFVPALIALFGASMLTPLGARRLGALVFAGSLLLMLIALVAAPEINGARRWLPLGPLALQPSETMKPGFAIVAAWMLAEGARTPGFPGARIAMGLYAVAVLILVLQPDYGQAALLTAAWMAMVFIAGHSLVWVAGFGVVGAATVGIGYFVSDHIARRIDGFFSAGCEGAALAGDNYQVCKATEAIAAGGLAGRGADAAEVKLSLPDAHTDFIFAVAGEEYGFFFCLAILALFAAFVLRVFARAASLGSVFAQVAACGLAATVGLQAFVNMGVALRALPAKGMTLPFVSYGGSSLIASALSVGLILSLTRAHGPVRSRREIMP